MLLLLLIHLHQQVVMNRETESLQDQPPIMGTWNKLYTFVLVLHIFLILVVYLLSIKYT